MKKYTVNFNVNFEVITENIEQTIDNIKLISNSPDIVINSISKIDKRIIDQEKAEENLIKLYGLGN